MKKAGIKIAAFILLLALCFALSNVIYTRWFYHHDIIEADAKMLLDIDSLQNTCEVLYFAESSNATTASSDSSKKSISEFIADRQQDVVQLNISFKMRSAGKIHPALHEEIIVLEIRKQTDIADDADEQE